MVRLILATSLLLVMGITDAFCGERHFSRENGMGGKPFDFVPREPLRKVEVCHGDHVDSICLYHGDWDLNSDDVNKSPLYGGNGGEKSLFTVPTGDKIIGVSVWADRGVDAMQFETETTCSSVYGKTNDSQRSYFKAPAGEELVGISGRSGKMLDEINFVFGTVKDKDVVKDKDKVEVEQLDVLVEA